MNAGIHWGLDSVAPANTKVSGGSTYYEYVCKQLSRIYQDKKIHTDVDQKPAFWGRYIGGRALSLTNDEIDFLLIRRCRIFLIYRGIISQSSVKGDRRTGNYNAKAAINAGLNLVNSNERASVYIYANIEGIWTVSKDWILGWWDAMWDSPFGGVGGFYCNTTLDRAFNNAYCDARKEYPIERTKQCYLFVQQLSNQINDPTFRNFRPKEPVCHSGSAVLWQYKTNCLACGNIASADMVLSNSAGFEAMIKTQNT